MSERANSSGLREVYYISMELKDITLAEVIKRMQDKVEVPGVQKIQMADLKAGDRFLVYDVPPVDPEKPSEDGLTLYSAVEDAYLVNGVWGVKVATV